MAEPPDNDATSDAAHEIAQLIANAREMFAPMDEAALGYRAQLINAGWGPSAAEQMAAQFFNLLIAMFTKGLNA